MSYQNLFILSSVLRSMESISPLRMHELEYLDRCMRNAADWPQFNVDHAVETYLSLRNDMGKPSEYSHEMITKVARKYIP